jgi:hypothetical protein
LAGLAFYSKTVLVNFRSIKTLLKLVEEMVENIVHDGGHAIVQLSMFLEIFRILTNGIGVFLCSPTIEECLNAIHPCCTLLVSLAVEIFKHVQLEGIEAFILCLATRNAFWLLSKEALSLPGFLSFTEYVLLLLHLPVF